jgi:hypothetical protein
MLTCTGTCVLAPPTTPPSPRDHTANTVCTAPSSNLNTRFSSQATEKPQPQCHVLAGRATSPAPKPSQPHPRAQPHRTCKKYALSRTILTGPRATGYVLCPVSRGDTQQTAPRGCAAPIDSPNKVPRKTNVRLCRVPKATKVREEAPGRIT